MKQLHIDSSSILCSHNYIDFKSKHVLLSSFNMIPYVCLAILDKLNLQPMGSCNGYSIACEQPMGNKIILNILRPTCLRQYYGTNEYFVHSDIVCRCTYIFGSKRNNAGTDPNKFVTKLFDKNMYNIAIYLKRLLCTNSKLLELDNLDLTHNFDSCTILSYFSHKNAKLASKMGFHCDNTYSLNGVYSKCANSQIGNTPVAIVSFGESRTLHLKKYN